MTRNNTQPLLQPPWYSKNIGSNQPSFSLLQSHTSPGAAPGTRRCCSSNSPCQFFFCFLMVICFPSFATTALGTFYLVMNFSSTLFPVFRVSSLTQIFVLEFSNDGSADHRDVCFRRLDQKRQVATKQNSGAWDVSIKSVRRLL